MQNLFMDGCPKDEFKTLVCKKRLHIPEQNWENLLGEGGGECTPLGHRRCQNGGDWKLIYLRAISDRLGLLVSFCLCPVSVFLTGTFFGKFMKFVDEELEQ